MRNLILTHLFLNLYLLAIVQPALPVIEYLLNYDYIVEQLCENRYKPVRGCNGKCYLGQKVEEQLELDRQDEQRTLPPKMELERLIVIVPESLSTDFKTVPLHAENPRFYLESSGLEHVSTLLRPPIAS